jgi:hypothetical protein
VVVSLTCCSRLQYLRVKANLWGGVRGLPVIMDLPLEAHPSGLGLDLVLRFNSLSADQV